MAVLVEDGRIFRQLLATTARRKALLDRVRELAGSGAGSRDHPVGGGTLAGISSLDELEARLGARAQQHDILHDARKEGHRPVYTTSRGGENKKWSPRDDHVREFLAHPADFEAHRTPLTQIKKDLLDRLLEYPLVLEAFSNAMVSEGVIDVQEFLVHGVVNEEFLDDHPEVYYGGYLSRSDLKHRIKTFQALRCCVAEDCSPTLKLVPSSGGDHCIHEEVGVLPKSPALEEEELQKVFSALGAGGDEDWEHHSTEQDGGLSPRSRSAMAGMICAEDGKLLRILETSWTKNPPLCGKILLLLLGNTLENDPLLADTTTSSGGGGLVPACSSSDAGGSLLKHLLLLQANKHEGAAPCEISPLLVDGKISPAAVLERLRRPEMHMPHATDDATPSEDSLPTLLAACEVANQLVLGFVSVFQSAKMEIANHKKHLAQDNVSRSEKEWRTRAMRKLLCGHHEEQLVSLGALSRALREFAQAGPIGRFALLRAFVLNPQTIPALFQFTEELILLAKPLHERCLFPPLRHVIFLFRELLLEEGATIFANKFLHVQKAKLLRLINGVRHFVTAHPRIDTETIEMLDNDRLRGALRDVGGRGGLVGRDGGRFFGAYFDFDHAVEELHGGEEGLWPV